MPALPPVPQVLKLVYQFQIGADADAILRWHFSYTGTAPSDATCATIAADIYADWVTNFQALLSVNDAIVGVQVTDLTSATAGQGEHLAITDGTRGGAPLAAGTAVLVNMPIPRRYRGGKPRSYMRLGDSGDISAAQAWASSFITSVTAAIQAHLDFLFALTVSGTSLSNWTNVSYYEGFTAVTNPITGRTKDVAKLRTGGPVTDVIGTFVVNPKPGSQRRRNLHGS